MKKIIVSTFLALVFVLTACSTSAPRPAASEAANPPAEASAQPAAATQSVNLPLVVGSSNETTVTEVVSLPLVVGSSGEAAATEAVSLPLVQAPGSDTATQAVSLPQVVSPGGGSALNTSQGALEVVSSRFVNEINGTKPEPGKKILLVILDRPGDERLTPDNFSLEAFDRARSESIGGQQVHVLTESGESVISTMGGWIDITYNEFAMGFMVPETAQTFQLIWPGNLPVDVTP